MNSDSVLPRGNGLPVSLMPAVLACIFLLGCIDPKYDTRRGSRPTQSVTSASFGGASATSAVAVQEHSGGTSMSDLVDTFGEATGGTPGSSGTNWNWGGVGGSTGAAGGTTAAAPTLLQVHSGGTLADNYGGTPGSSGTNWNWGGAGDSTGAAGGTTAAAPTLLQEHSGGTSADNYGGTPSSSGTNWNWGGAGGSTGAVVTTVVTGNTSTIALPDNSTAAGTTSMASSANEAAESGTPNAHPSCILDESTIDDCVLE